MPRLKLHGMAATHIQINGMHRCGPVLERLRCNFRQLPRPPCCQQQPRAFRRKSYRCGRAYARAGPCDKDNLPLQTHVFSPNESMFD